MNFTMVSNSHITSDVNDYPTYTVDDTKHCLHCGVSVKEIDGRITYHLKTCAYRRKKEGFYEGPIPMTERRLQAGLTNPTPFPQTLKETFPPSPIPIVKPPAPPVTPVVDLQSLTKNVTELANQLNSDFTELVFHNENAGGKQGLAMHKLSIAHQKVQAILNQLTGRSNA